MKNIRELFASVFATGTPPVVTENSSLRELETPYPHVYEFIERKYGLKLDASEKTLSLKDFAEKYGLPPAQILFMEIQMAIRSQHVFQIKPSDAMKLMKKNQDLKIIDVRDEWETKFGAVTNSLPLTPQLMDTILTEWDKQTPILVYCHFGVRGMDFATFLTDRGFTKVYNLSGGIDAWSDQIDRSIPKYEGNYCWSYLVTPFTYL